MASYCTIMHFNIEIIFISQWRFPALTPIGILVICKRRQNRKNATIYGACAISLGASASSIQRLPLFYQSCPKKRQRLPCLPIVSCLRLYVCLYHGVTDLAACDGERNSI